jgi:hypothetical protein
VLAPSAAGSVLDLDDDVHQWFAFVSSSQGGSCFFSSCSSLHNSGFRFGSYGPDEAQQFAAHRCDDLPLIFIN